MTEDNTYEKWKYSAVSELIGTILLVGLVIAAMAIITVLLISNPPPEEIPHLNVLASRDVTSRQFFLYHNGGDVLLEEKTVIRINNDPAPVPRNAIAIQYANGTRTKWYGTNIPWKIGDTLIIPSATDPMSIALIYQGSTSQSLIFTATFIQGS